MLKSRRQLNSGSIPLTGTQTDHTLQIGLAMNISDWLGINTDQELQVSGIDWETFDWMAAAVEALAHHLAETGCAFGLPTEVPDGPTASLYYCPSCGEELAI